MYASFKLLRQQDDIGVFLVCMEGVPGAIRQCISRTRGSREVLIMRRLRKRPCQHVCFPMSLVLATSRTAMGNLPDYDREHASGVTGQQRMFTPPSHLILPLSFYNCHTTINMYQHEFSFKF